MIRSGLSIDGVHSKINCKRNKSLLVKLRVGVLTQSKGIVAGIRGDIFSCVFFFFAIKTRANYLYSHIISLQK